MRHYQADITIILIGICGFMVFFVCLSSYNTKAKKHSLILLESSAMLLMIFDLLAQLFRGDASPLGWWMVRISNFLVFFLVLAAIFAFNQYLIDLYTHEGGLSSPPKRLKAANILSLLGMMLVVLSQFTGLYYTFDEMNRYQRAPGFFISYVIPIAILLLQLSVILQYYRRLSRSLRISLLLFSLIFIFASICQLFIYGISLNNISIAIMAVLLYVFSLLDMNRQLDHANKLEVEYYKKEHKREHALFEQVSEALASAIDAKDEYTHGHSARVANYATQIAKEAGKSSEECERVYFAGLLHDVGKIGVPDAIINKSGKLTEKEYSEIKRHPIHGNRILSQIQLSPYLSVGALYHHERYDGRGYPEGLKGEEIPDLARIIAVADAYDAMTSKRSYRDAIPQQKVREELVKGMGTQFDPTYAKIMLHLIDLDTEYLLREQTESAGDELSSQIHCKETGLDCSAGILLTDKKVHIHLSCQADAGFTKSECLPTLILFDALDGQVHRTDQKGKDLLYFEYGQISFDGTVLLEGARKIKTDVSPQDAAMNPGDYVIEAVRLKDHALIRISGSGETMQHIIALPDNSRYAFISLTGTHCTISGIRADRDEAAVGDGYIPRIAEEISFIQGCPEGDLPNLQIDGWRTKTTAGILIPDAMTFTFHTRTLPSACFVWHCPFLTVFTSDNGRVDGKNYREFLLFRLDGENWEDDDQTENRFQISHTRNFVSWDAWKEINKQGIDCEVTIRRSGSRIICSTENLGIAITSVTTIKDNVSDLYAALTGDQCALTNIHVKK